MSAVVIILTAIIFLMLGFLFGSLRTVTKKPQKSEQRSTVPFEIIKEYENFLNYDGTEQT